MYILFITKSPDFVSGDGMRNWSTFVRRGLALSTHAQMSLQQALSRFSTSDRLKRALAYFLWIPAVVFVNDHVISLSPVNGISMRPVVLPLAVLD
jgi:hypothetical protein